MTTDENLGKAAIFDLDGTLLDSMDVWDQIDAAFLAKRGITVPDDYMETVTAMQFREIARYTIDRFGLDDTEDGLMAEWDRMAHDAYTSVVQPKAHALDYLRYLNQDDPAVLRSLEIIREGKTIPAKPIETETEKTDSTCVQ